MLNSFNSFIKGFAAKILLVLLVLSFAVWGVGDMVRTGGATKELASVGKVDISMNEFQRSLDREKQNMQRALGAQYKPELLKSMQLPQQVLQGLIQRSLLLQEASALGIRPSDADIASNIHNNPAFHDDKGHFDKDMFKTRLKSSNLTEKAYVEQLRNQMALELLMGSVSGHAMVHSKAVETLFLSRSQQRNFALYIMDESLVVAPEPKKEDIEAFYKSNESLFSAPEYRTLSYVRFTSADLPEAKLSKEDIAKVYEERLDEFRLEERRTIQQLLFSSEEKAKEAHAMAKAGKSFKDIAKEKHPSNENALSLGAIPRSGLFDEAASIVFAMKKDEVSDPIKSPFGWHIFRVDAITPPGVKPLEEVRAGLEKDLNQTHQDDAINRMANSLEDALAGGATLADVANERTSRVLKRIHWEADWISSTCFWAIIIS